LKTLKIKYF